jgi:hypothetical protein
MLHISFLEEKTKNLKYKKIVFIFVLFLSIPFSHVYAATLSIESSNTQLKVGDVVTATVYVNSEGETINNVEGLITVPSDILEIQSVSNSGSVLNLWVEQPSYSKGSVTFNGGIPNPGFKGIKGKVVTIFMKAIRDGSASVTFQAASVRANDGLGTDVIKSKYGTTINISSPLVIPETAPVISVNIPGAPIISSSLTPDSSKWYNTDSTTFSWNLPKDVTAIKTLLGQYPDSEPSILYSPAISKKTVENLGDGVWYFHMRYQNSSGWGKIAHKKIQIDNTAPRETEVTYQTLDSGLVEIKLKGDDETSSVAKYILSTPTKENIELSNINDGETAYVFPSDYFGTKEIKIETFDQAGNSSIVFIIIDFPHIQSAESPIAEPKEIPILDPVYILWGNKIIGVLSILIPILAMVLLFVAFVYMIFKKVLFVDRTREKKINKIEKETIALLDTLKDNIKEDIHLFKMDKSIHDVSEAEKILLGNLLLDFKNIEKIIDSRLRKIKNRKKDIEELE